MTAYGTLPVYFPTHVNLYLQCPERYLHQQIEKKNANLSLDNMVTKGIAAHHILGTIAREYQKSIDRQDGYDGPAVRADFLAQAEAILPRALYSTEGAWRLDVQSLIEDIKYGVAYFDGEARVLASEATLYFPYARGRDCPPFVLAAKIDLLLMRHDSEGQPYLDVVDFKTGKSLKIDRIQEITARIVVKQNDILFGTPHAKIQNTTIYLGARAVRSEMIEDEECGRSWAKIKQMVRAVHEEADWLPNPSPLCGWCPYFNDGCSLTPDGNRANDLGEWLDGMTK